MQSAVEGQHQPARDGLAAFALVVAGRTMKRESREGGLRLTALHCTALHPSESPAWMLMAVVVAGRDDGLTSGTVVG
jgi:hypothetical protein